MHNTKLAVIFPGQSSQHVGMLSALSMHFKLIRETFSEVSEILGYDLWSLAQNGPINKLNQTVYAQPIILTASVAIWRIWKSQGGQIPNIMAGHSLGEYSALVCSGSIDLLSASKLVRIRGMLMQEAVPDGYGSMSVIIGLRDDVVIELCNVVTSSCNLIVSPACFNALDNVVVAGHKTAVDKVNILCKKAGAKYVSTLPISIPSHCALMKPIVNKFKKELEKIVIHIPTIPIINNTDLYIGTEPEIIRNALIRQLYVPIRWHEIIQNLVNRKVEKFVEMGPSRVLSRLIRNSFKDLYSISVNDPYSLSEAIKAHRN